MPERSDWQDIFSSSLHTYLTECHDNDLISSIGLCARWPRNSFSWWRQGAVWAIDPSSSSSHSSSLCWGWVATCHGFFKIALHHSPFWLASLSPRSGRHTQNNFWTDNFKLYKFHHIGNPNSRFKVSLRVFAFVCLYPEYSQGASQTCRGLLHLAQTPAKLCL